MPSATVFRIANSYILYTRDLQRGDNELLYLPVLYDLSFSRKKGGAACQRARPPAPSRNCYSTVSSITLSIFAPQAPFAVKV